MVLPEPGPPTSPTSSYRPSWINWPISSSSGIASPVTGEMMRGRTRARSAGKPLTASTWADGSSRSAAAAADSGLLSSTSRPLSSQGSQSRCGADADSRHTQRFAGMPDTPAQAHKQTQDCTQPRTQGSHERTGGHRRIPSASSMITEAITPATIPPPINSPKRREDCSRPSSLCLTVAIIPASKRPMCLGAVRGWMLFPA